MPARLVLLAVLSSALSAACASPLRYAVTYRIHVRQDRDEKQSEITDPKVPELLRGAVTVAFLPPDFCRDVHVGDRDASRGSAFKLSCGALLADLERRATELNFRVVSWQTLRGRERAIDYAQSQHVDIIFELNELNDYVVRSEGVTAGEMRFFVKTRSRWAKLHLEDAERVFRRCERTILSRVLPIINRRIGVGLDVKMVSVKTGQSVWYYHRTGADFIGEKPFSVYYDDISGLGPDRAICNIPPVFNPKTPIGEPDEPEGAEQDKDGSMRFEQTMSPEEVERRERATLLREAVRKFMEEVAQIREKANPKKRLGP